MIKSMNVVQSKSIDKSNSSKRNDESNPYKRLKKRDQMPPTKSMKSVATGTTTESANAATTSTATSCTSAATTENEDIKKKYATRGPNKCANLQVKVNDYGQPKCKNARILSSYLGLLARDPKLIPFDLEDWRKFLNERTEEALWKIILTRFTFEGPIPKEWIVDNLDHCLRSWRVKLKAKHYKIPKAANATLEMLLQPPDRRLDPDQWKKMVHYWESPEGQACSERNTLNRNSTLMAHHLGSKSFARLREEKTKDGKELDKLELFMIAYGQPTKNLVGPEPASAKLIAEIEAELLNLPPDCDVASEREMIFQQKVGDDKRGYKRTYGIGVKNQIVGTSKQRVTEACLMVEAERQKREALEEEIAAEKQKRIELEYEVAIQEEKRKELEEAMEGEKKKRETLEDQVHKLTSIVLQIQANGGLVL